MTEFPDFPNGFASWQRTHFEVVEVLCYLRGLEESKQPETITNISDKSATEELYNLALHLTNKFETLHEFEKPQRNLFDEIEDFVLTEIKAMKSKSSFPGADSKG